MMVDVQRGLFLEPVTKTAGGAVVAADLAVGIGSGLRTAAQHGKPDITRSTIITARKFDERGELAVCWRT